jgi:MerR-like DNA binding protein
VSITAEAQAPEVPQLLGSAEVCRHAGITYRRLDYWCTHGLLEHVPRGPGAGSGHDRQFTREQADRAVTMGRLVAAGVAIFLAAKIARSGEARYEVSPGIWLEIGPALSDECGEDDHGACFPDEPSACGCDCHEEPQP